VVEDACEVALAATVADLIDADRLLDTLDDETTIPNRLPSVPGTASGLKASSRRSIVVQIALALSGGRSWFAYGRKIM
jgi:hypothetical protein